MHQCLFTPAWIILRDNIGPMFPLYAPPSELGDHKSSHPTWRLDCQIYEAFQGASNWLLVYLPSKCCEASNQGLNPRSQSIILSTLPTHLSATSNICSTAAPCATNSSLFHATSTYCKVACIKVQNNFIIACNIFSSTNLYGTPPTNILSPSNCLSSFFIIFLLSTFATFLYCIIWPNHFL